MFYVMTCPKSIEVLAKQGSELGVTLRAHHCWFTPEFCHMAIMIP
jgi:hypothetical protein